MPFTIPGFNPYAPPIQIPDPSMGGQVDPGVTGMPGNAPAPAAAQKPGLLDFLSGPTDPSLDPDTRQALNNQFLLTLGASLLAGSRSGQGLAPILGQSFLAAQQGKQSSIDAQLQRVLLKAKLKQAQEGDKTPGIQEYEYAKANGYTGSFEQWKQSGGGMSAQQDPAAIQEYNFYAKLTPEQQKQFLQIKRGQVAGTVTQIEGGQALVNRVTGDVQKLSTPEAERAAAEQRAQAMATGTGRGAAEAAIETKAPAAASMEYVLKQFDEQLPKTTQGGVGGIKGKSGALFDYKDATRFDNLKEQLSTELRTLYRIPGEGSLSDNEQALYGIQLPSRNNDPEVNRQILEDLRTRTKLRLPQSAGGRGASSSFDAPATRKYNPATGKIE